MDNIGDSLSGQKMHWLRPISSDISYLNGSCTVSSFKRFLFCQHQPFKMWWGNAHLSALLLLLVAHSQAPGVSNVVAPLCPASGQSECEQPRQTPKEQQFGESEEGILNLEQNNINMLTCCLLPRLVITVKFIVPYPLTDCASESSSFSSTLFLRIVGGRTADSQRARAVFLSTFRDSAEVSVTIFASSLANSASASSEGPRCSWRLLLPDSITSWSGEGGRSSIWDIFGVSDQC